MADGQCDACHSNAIRKLNDAFRSAQHTIGGLIADGHLALTRGVTELGPDFVRRAIHTVRDFADFAPENDPHGEHDFGAFTLDGVRLNWKIDYYDTKLEYGSPDPADHAKTRRVLTVLLAEEY